MNISDRSVWRDVPLPQFPALTESIEVDIAIIGGGITGIIAAYLLCTSGKRVAILEGGELAGWATGSTTAFIMEYLDTDPSGLIRRFGKESALRITQAHRDAINWYEAVVRDEQIECEFARCCAYVYEREKGSREQLLSEDVAAQQLGMSTQMRDSAPALTSGAALEVRNQAKFHPLKFVARLAEIARASGVEIYGSTKVLQVAGTDPIIVTCEKAVVKARRVLMATQAPLDPQPKKLAFKKAWYSTYVLAAKLPTGVVPEGLYIDTAHPYHYLRVDAAQGHDRIIVGGEDHRSDIPFDKETAFANLETFLKDALPGTSYTLTNHWKGGISEPGDGLAYLGPIGSGDIFYATGYSGNGITYAVIAATMFAALCSNEPNPYPEFAADRRLSLRAYLPKAFEYVQEFLSGVLKNSLLRKSAR